MDYWLIRGLLHLKQILGDKVVAKIIVNYNAVIPGYSLFLGLVIANNNYESPRYQLELLQTQRVAYYLLSNFIEHKASVYIYIYIDTLTITESVNKVLVTAIQEMIDPITEITCTYTPPIGAFKPEVML